MDENTTNFQDIDINSTDFYDKVQAELDSDLARIKKNIEIIMYLRLEAAEVEVETAYLYHAELWHDVMMLQNPPEISSDEDDSGADDVDDNMPEDTKCPD